MKAIANWVVAIGDLYSSPEIVYCEDDLDDALAVIRQQYADADEGFGTTNVHLLQVVPLQIKHTVEIIIDDQALKDRVSAPADTVKQALLSDCS